MDKNIKFLYEYLNAFAPVAQENEGQKIWKDYVTPLVDEMYTDPYGTAYGIVYKSDGRVNPRKVVIEAHCDEIAWIITHIEKEGFVRVKRHGGSDNMIAPSMTVMVHTDSGKKIPGVFGWPAIHTRKEYVSKGYEQEELWVDLGVSSDEAVKELGIEVGNLITFDQELHELGDYYVGRSLDNKIGGYIIAEALRRIKEEGTKLPYDLYVVNSVQEEVGLYGAKMIAKRLGADIALVHDVCHNTNHPKMDKAKDGDVKGGKGPALEYTAQNHRMINQRFIEVAKEKEIPYQRHVGSYGNDTMAFFLENTPTAILATPLKYMHTTVEMAHKQDVENCITLFVEVLKSITPKWIDQVHNK
jgi:putative aminopeptidase FrvX